MEIAKNLKAALFTINGTLTKLKEELVETNSLIGALNAKICHLSQMPISLEDWGKYFKAAVEKMAESHLPYVHEEMLQNNPHRGHIARNQRSWAYFEENRDNQLLGMDLFAEQGSPLRAMCFFFPDVIYERVMARLKECIGAKWGNDDLPSVEERRKLVAEMQQEFEALKRKQTELEVQIEEISGAISS